MGGNSTDVNDMPFIVGPGLGLFVGLGVFCVVAAIATQIIEYRDDKALNSNAAVQTEGSLTSVSTATDGYGGTSAWFLNYEFHVPNKHGNFGAKVTGKLSVPLQKYSLHSAGLPKDCTIRYVSASPRRSTIIAIGADNDLQGSTAPQSVVRKLMSFTMPLFILGFSLYGTLMSWNSKQVEWGTGALVGWWVVVGGFFVFSLYAAIRTSMRLPIWRGKKTPGIAITRLDGPYAKPVVVQQPAVLAVNPAVEMMAVQCPQGVQPGQMIQIATPAGAAMAVQVPAGVAPGGTFQVAVTVVP